MRNAECRVAGEAHDERRKLQRLIDRAIAELESQRAARRRLAVENQRLLRAVLDLDRIRQRLLGQIVTGN